MTMTQIRSIIRNHANDRDCKYRITANGEVHYYGVMPNTNVTGWYFMDQDAAALAKEIAAGIR